MVADAEAVEPLGDRHEEACDEGAPLLLAFAQFLGDVRPVLRFEVAEGDVLQFALDVVESQLVGDLGVEVQRLPALLAPLLAREDGQRAHDFETVREFDEDHARVLGVGHQQVAEIVGLLAVGLELGLGDVAQPHGDARDRGAEALADPVGEGEEFGFRQLLVGDAHGVVEQRRDGRVVPEADFAQHDGRHGRRMVEQRRAVVARAALQPFVREGEGLLGEREVLFRKVGTHQRAEGVVSCGIHGVGGFES